MNTRTPPEENEATLRLFFEKELPFERQGELRYVDLRAEMDVIVLISNCPQLNNPCNAYNPTPAELLVWN